MKKDRTYLLQLVSLVVLTTVSCARQTGNTGVAVNHPANPAVAQLGSVGTQAAGNVLNMDISGSGSPQKFELVCFRDSSGAWDPNTLSIPAPAGTTMTVADPELATAVESSTGIWTVAPSCASIWPGGDYQSQLFVDVPGIATQVFDMTVVQPDTIWVEEFAPTLGGMPTNPEMLEGYGCLSNETGTVDVPLEFYISSGNTDLSQFEYYAADPTVSGALMFGPATLSTQPPPNGQYSPYSNAAIVTGELQVGDAMFSSFHIDCSKLVPGQEIDIPISVTVTWYNDQGPPTTSPDFVFKLTKASAPVPTPSPTPVPSPSPRANSSTSPLPPPAPSCPGYSQSGAMIDCSIDLAVLAQSAAGLSSELSAPGVLSYEKSVFADEIEGETFTIAFTPGQPAIWTGASSTSLGQFAVPVGAAGDIPQIIASPGDDGGNPVIASFHGPTAVWTYGTVSAWTKTFSASGSVQWGDGGDIPMTLNTQSSAPLVGVFRPSNGEFIYSLDNNSWSGSNYGIIWTGFDGAIPIYFVGSPTGQINWVVLTAASGYRSFEFGSTTMIEQSSGTGVYYGQNTAEFPSSAAQLTAAEASSFFLTWGAIFQ